MVKVSLHSSRAVAETRSNYNFHYFFFFYIFSFAAVNNYWFQNKENILQDVVGCQIVAMNRRTGGGTVWGVQFL